MRTQKNPLAWFGERVGEIWFLDLDQPIAPRIRVVIVVIVIIMPPANGIAALESARSPVLVGRLIMGSQKCTDLGRRSTRKEEIAKISCSAWQMGYNLVGVIASAAKQSTSSRR